MILEMSGVRPGAACVRSKQGAKGVAGSAVKWEQPRGEDSHCLEPAGHCMDFAPTPTPPKWEGVLESSEELR